MKPAFHSIFAALAAATVLSGCAENKPYRLLGIDDAARYYSDQKPWFESVPVSDERNYRISFVEFDERGDFWDRGQLRETARAIEHTRKPVLLVTYIHGWHHNANDRKPGGQNPGDVQTFRCLLSELAVSESTKDYQVHGVYLGWRGRLIEGPLDYLTFLDRKAAATRIAGTPVTETIRADPTGAKEPEIEMRGHRSFIWCASVGKSNGTGNDRENHRPAATWQQRTVQTGSRFDPAREFRRGIALRQGND